MTTPTKHTPRHTARRLATAAVAAIVMGRLDPAPSAPVDAPAPVVVSAHAEAGQSPAAVLYLPAIRQAPPRELAPAGPGWGEVAAVVASGDRALVGDGTQVVAYRLGADQAPAEVGRTPPVGGIVRRIVWDAGATAYVVTRAATARLRPGTGPAGQLSVAVVVDPWPAPRVAARGLAAGLSDVAIHADHAFVCGGVGFTVHDLADPARWRVVAQVAVPGGPPASGQFTCRHDGEHTLGILGTRDGYLLRYDVADPAQPRLVGSSQTGTGTARFALSDFAVEAGALHTVWRMTPMAGAPQHVYVPSDMPPLGDDAPGHTFGYGEVPGPPTLRDGLAWFAGRLGSSGAGALTAVEPRGADKPLSSRSTAWRQHGVDGDGEACQHGGADRGARPRPKRFGKHHAFEHEHVDGAGRGVDDPVLPHAVLGVQRVLADPVVVGIARREDLDDQVRGTVDAELADDAPPLGRDEEQVRLDDGPAAQSDVARCSERLARPGVRRVRVELHQQPSRYPLVDRARCGRHVQLSFDDLVAKAVVRQARIVVVSPPPWRRPCTQCPGGGGDGSHNHGARTSAAIVAGLVSMIGHDSRRRPRPQPAWNTFSLTVRRIGPSTPAPAAPPPPRPPLPAPAAPRPS